MNEIDAGGGIEGDPSPANVGLLDRVRAAPYRVRPAGVLAVAAYLCLVNLDYAALWHDEAPTALIGLNLLERGDIVGWDGRNLVGGTNGRTLNEDLRDVLPPLMYVLNAAGIAVFGVNETGARITPALIGILSLAMLYLLLREHLARWPRLIFFMLLFAAWSPQLLLYFRQSRYYAFMAFGVIAAFHFYERWWRTGKKGHLAALTAVAALAFFNHYAGGAATMLALASWHLMFRARETTPRQWLALAAGGVVVVVLGAAYLAWVGVIGGERSGFLAYTGVVGRLEGHRGTLPPVLLRIGVYTRDLFTSDWISWPVCVWFAAMLSSMLVRRLCARPGSGPTTAGDDLPVAAAARIVLMGALFALFAAALSVQRLLSTPFTDLRYYMGAIPLLLAMKGLFIEWAWRRSRIAGSAMLAVLLLSSAGAWPFNMTNLLTGKRTLGLHTLQFVREIHRPYRDSIRVVSDYLLEHAEQDDLVYVPGFANREALTFTTGHRVLFCCVLDGDTPLPPATIEDLGVHLSVESAVPDWIVLFAKPDAGYLETLRKRYHVAAQLDVYHYPTQRPEINIHAFTPLPARQSGVHVLRRKATDTLYREAEELRTQQRHEAALASYRKVLEIDAEHAPAHAGLGLTLFALQRYQEARGAMMQAISLQPDLPIAGLLHRLMGRAAQEVGRTSEAAEHYGRALQIDPRDVEALDRLAMTRFGQRQYEEALSLYKRLVEIGPDGAQTHANVGATLYYLGRADEAIRSYEHALSLNPSLELARAALEHIRKAVRQDGP